MLQCARASAATNLKLFSDLRTKHFFHDDVAGMLLLNGHTDTHARAS
jgi:hypothetical protein